MICVGAPRRVHTDAAYQDAATRWIALTARNWEKSIWDAWEAVTFVARYGAQSVEQVEEWPPSKIFRVARMLGEHIKKESPKSLRGSSGATW
jgi:hypothetical protein